MTDNNNSNPGGQGDPMSENLNILLQRTTPQEVVILWQELLSGAGYSRLQTGSNILMALFGKCEKDPTSEYGLNPEVTARQEELAHDVNCSANAVQKALGHIMSLQQTTGVVLLTQDPLAYFQGHNGQIRCSPYTYHLDGTMKYLRELHYTTLEMLEKSTSTRMNFRFAARFAREKVFGHPTKGEGKAHKQKSNFAALKALIKNLRFLGDGDSDTSAASFQIRELIYAQDRKGNYIISEDDRKHLLDFLATATIALMPAPEIDLVH